MAGLIEIPLESSERPIITIKADLADIDCLIDTGSNIPIWCADEDLLQLYYPDARRTDYRTLIGGFGEGTDIADLWQIPLFVINGEDGEGSFEINNLYVAVYPKKQFSFLFILSITLFLKSDISFIYRTEAPFLRIVTDRELYGVVHPHVFTEGEESLRHLFIQDKERPGNLIDHVSVFLKEPSPSTHVLR